MTARAAIGLGANLGDRATTLRAALVALGRAGTVVASSSLYRSAPWGVPDQPEFLNAAVLLETDLEPHELLEMLQSIERELGRTPGERWGPRALDLDLLTYDDRRITDVRLVVPHARMLERAFVLMPLSEIDSGYTAALAALAESDRAEVRLFEGGTEEIESERHGSMGSAAELPPELEPVRRVIELFTASGLVSLHAGSERFSIRVARRGALAQAAQRSAHSRNIVFNGIAEISPPAASRPGREVVSSDLVGIVRFSRPAPLVGDRLDSDRELAYVEALGIRNPVRSRGSGTIVEILVEDGAVVDFGRPLFAIARV
jgi:2-amino-4-hydroxy-6-hydroxymethyldihydropteridine diphosphokinase